MALFKKKDSDPISERARALNAEIAALEQKIKQLDSKAQQRQGQPRLRSTAVPHGSTITHKGSATPASPPPAAHEPVFEEVGKDLLKVQPETSPRPGLFNEQGVRKYDLPAFLRRIRSFFQGPQASNPRLVNYLAAGGVQGLRPMRYEKRVARNRFFALTTLFLLLLTGILWWYYRTR
jgi:hypothetical protein